jgi:hypothetical protein
MLLGVKTTTVNEHVNLAQHIIGIPFNMNKGYGEFIVIACGLAIIYYAYKLTVYMLAVTL